MGLWCYLLTTPLKNCGGLLTVLYRGYPYLWMSVSTEDCEKFEELVIHGIAPPPPPLSPTTCVYPPMSNYESCDRGPFRLDELRYNLSDIIF